MEAVNTFKEKGNEAFRSRRWLESLEAYSSALEVLHKLGEDPKEKSRLLSNRSVALSSLSRWTEALKDAEECQKLDPKWYRGFIRAVSPLVRLKREAEAAEACAQAWTLSLDPTSLSPPSDVLEAAKALRLFTTPSGQKALHCINDVKYPRDLIVVDPSGLGHATTLSEALQRVEGIRRPSTLVVRPGTYSLSWAGNATLQVLGDVPSTTGSSDLNALKSSLRDLIRIEFPTNPYAPAIFFCPSKSVNWEFRNISFSSCPPRNGSMSCHCVGVSPQGPSSDVKVSFESCIFESMNGAAIAITAGNFSLSKCYFKSCFHAVLVHSAVGSFNCCLIDTCEIIGVELRGPGASGTFDNCIIRDCNRQAVLAYSGADSVLISNCTIERCGAAIKNLTECASVQAVCKSFCFSDSSILSSKSDGIVIEELTNFHIERSVFNGFKTGILVGIGEAHGVISECKFNKGINGISVLGKRSGTYSKPLVKLVGNTFTDITIKVLAPDPARVEVSGDKTDVLTAPRAELNEFLTRINMEEWAVLSSAERKKNRSDIRSGKKGPVDITCFGCGEGELVKARKFKKCSRCFEAYYCSEKCQREHWPTHKLSCGAVKDFLENES